MDIKKIVTITTKDLDFIEENSCDLYPYVVWIDASVYQNNKSIKEFMDCNTKERDLLLSKQIDFVVVEYDL